MDFGPAYLVCSVVLSARRNAVKSLRVFRPVLLLNPNTGPRSPPLLVLFLALVLMQTLHAKHRVLLVIELLLRRALVHMRSANGTCIARGGLMRITARAWHSNLVLHHGRGKTGGRRDRFFVYVRWGFTRL